MVILVNHFTDFTEPWRWLGAGAQLWLHHGLDPSRGQLHLQVEQGRAVPVLCWNISRMIRLKTTFTDITADTLYDVLHDPVYRKVRMIAGRYWVLITLHLHFRPGTSTCCAPGSSVSWILIMTSLTTPSSVPRLWRTETLSSRDPGYKHHRRWVAATTIFI